jgi:cyanophycinase
MRYHVRYQLKYQVKFFRTAAVALLALLSLSTLDAQSTRGSLVIIGGGRRSDVILRRFIELAQGWTGGKIVVFPNASSEPDTSGMDQVAEFREHGATNVEFLLIDRTAALLPESAARLDSAKGIFFTGGDQARLTRDLLNTPVLEKIRELYADGAVIGGTSAGAAVMSKIMLTGDEVINKDPGESFAFMKKGNVVTVEGFGFLKDVIIDQHFVRRKRHNRLLSVVMENPEKVAAGIDESTALVVHPDGIMEVLGERSVVVYDARGAKDLRLDPRGNQGVTGIVQHILLSGDRYDPERGTVTPGESR